MRADLDAWMSHRFSWKVFEMNRWLTTTGFIGAHVRDFARIAREYQQREPVTVEQFAQIKAFHDSRRHGTPDDGFGAASGANVLMIQVEAMQEWVVHAKVRDQWVMPFARDLMGKSLYFSNIWDQTGASPTSDCEYMVFNSQHPLARGAVAFRRQDNDFVPLPKLLGELGYTTLSAHAYRRGMWNRAVLHPRYGFEHSLFARELGSKPRLGWGLADREFFQRVVPHLQKLKKPWFSFLITLTSHHPYTYIPRKLRKLNTAGMQRELAGYLHSMRYVDDSLRELFGELRRSELLGDTLVVLFGDHDSKLKFNERTRRGAAKHLGLPPEMLDHLAQRHWQTKKIPLWLTLPDESRVGHVERVGGQIDIGPTVMYYLGAPSSPAWLGRPLVGDAGEVVRLDGSAAASDLLWAAETRTCHDRQTGTTLDQARCSDLAERGGRELGHSWTVTLENLAARLHVSPDP
jgi:phosphoglycerol transferase MdoB-like AlkP superfamily enzyme